MTELEVLDINVAWGRGTRASFRIRMTNDDGKKYLMIADNLVGEVWIVEEK